MHPAGHAAAGADAEPEGFPQRGAADALFSAPPLPEQPGPADGSPSEPPAAVSGAEHLGQPLSDQLPEANSSAPQNCAAAQSDVAFFSTREDGAGPFDPVPAKEEQTLGAGAAAPGRPLFFSRDFFFSSARLDFFSFFAFFSFFFFSGLGPIMDT